MAYCSQCGAQIADEIAFCTECGAATSVEDGTSYEVVEPLNTHGRTKYCATCGEQMPEDAFYCFNCGNTFPTVSDNSDSFEQVKLKIDMQSGVWKNKWVAFFLCIFLGMIGAHKFYEEKRAMGVVYVFTLGFWGIGWIVDIIILSTKPNPYRARW